MGKWYSFGGVTTRNKSLEAKKKELEELKKARDAVKQYNEIEAEKKKLQAEIRQEGFKTRHAKLYGLLNSASSTSRKIATNAASAARTAAKSKEAKSIYRQIKKELK